MTVSNILPPPFCQKITKGGIYENFLKRLVIEVAKATFAQDFNPHVADNLCHHRALMLPQLADALPEVQKLAAAFKSKSVPIGASALSEKGRQLVDFFLLTKIKAPHPSRSKEGVNVINHDLLCKIHKGMAKLPVTERKELARGIQARVHALAQEKFSTMDFLSVLHNEKAVVGIAQLNEPAFAFFQSDGIRFHPVDKVSVKIYRVIVLKMKDKVETLKKLKESFDETIIKAEVDDPTLPCHILTAHCQGRMV